MLIIVTKLSRWIICYGYLQTGADIHVLIKNGHQWRFQPTRFTQRSALVTTMQNQLPPTSLLSLIKQKCCEQGHQMFKIDVCEDFPKLMFYNMMDITWPSWKEVIHESLRFHIFIVITDSSSSFGNFRYFFPFPQQRHSISLWCRERGDRNTERLEERKRRGLVSLSFWIFVPTEACEPMTEYQVGKAVWQSSGFTSKG